MNPFLEFVINNFILLFIVITMVLVLIFNKRLNKKKNILIGGALLLALVLAILLAIEAQLYKDNNVIGAVIVSYLGYVLRPVCVLLFISLIDERPSQHSFIFVIPLLINAIYYMSALFINVPELYSITFYFTTSPDGLVFHRGYFNFVAHIVSFLYLAYLVYVNLKILKRKHLLDGIIVLTGAIAVIVSVILEAAGVAKNLLNNVIAVYTVFYYLFLYVEETKRDPLTNLFDRRAYYRDLSKYDRQINGVAVIDMNGLKFLNDNYGHLEGDKGLITIGQTLEKVFKSQLVYRVGGDEFVVLFININEDKLNDLKESFLNTLGETKYRASIGVALKNKDEDYASLLKRAEVIMYEEKARYYEDGKHNRRKN